MTPHEPAHFNLLVRDSAVGEIPLLWPWAAGLHRESICATAEQNQRSGGGAAIGFVERDDSDGGDGNAEDEHRQGQLHNRLAAV